MFDVLSLLMLVVFLVAGVLLGYLLRGEKHVNLNHVVFWVILVLIFFLGFSIGSNNELLNSIPTVGLDAVVLSLLAMVFSVFFVKVARKVVRWND